MKAAVVPQVGAKCEVREVRLRETQAGEVRVRIAATGVCHSDLSFQNGTIPSPMPCILGHEGAGIVEEVGPNVTTVKPGDHVIINWLPACGVCYFCVRGESQLCPAGRGEAGPRHFLGEEPVTPVAGMGTFAEEVLVGENAVVPIPADVPLEIGALIGCGVTTGVGAAMNTARVVPGSSVAVIGCGGVGINIIQGARLCGAATIVAVDKVPAKLEAARKFGATYGVTPEDLPARARELTGGVGFDYAFEAIGLPATIRAAWDVTRRGGTTVVVGVGRVDEQVSFSPMELFVSEKKLLGCVYGSANVRRDFPRLIELWRTGRLDLEGLISRRLRLDQVNEAFDAMARGEVIRQVITFG